MHIQALGLIFVGLWSCTSCVPLNAAASGHLTERSPIQAIDNQNQENTLRHANGGIRKREDDSGAIVNAVVEYDDDEITKREDDSGAIVNAVVEYDDDEITK